MEGGGAAEAKPQGTLTGVEAQSAKYAAGLPDNLPAHRRPLPFLFESNGSVTYFTNGLDPTPRSRKVFNFARPETLAEWIPFNGLTHIKIKLNGDDLGWDVERVVRVDRVADQAQRQRGVERWHYSLDFNERCPNVEYLLAVLRQAKEQTPAGFERIQYIEQPTARDLKQDRGRQQRRTNHDPRR